MAKSETATKDTRKRNWTFIVYPDSAPEGWQAKLDEQHIPGFISPLHDKDLNPDGEPKKPHYHVMLLFKGKKSFEQIQEISDGISGVRVEPVKDAHSLARYFCHLDNPEKAQYSIGEVCSLAGADFLANIESAADTDLLLAEIEDFIDAEEIFSYRKLCQYARANRPDWYRVISSKRTIHLSTYLRSAQWEANKVKDEEKTEREICRRISEAVKAQTELLKKNADK